MHPSRVKHTAGRKGGTFRVTGNVTPPSIFNHSMSCSASFPHALQAASGGSCRRRRQLTLRGEISELPRHEETSICAREGEEEERRQETTASEVTNERGKERLRRFGGRCKWTRRPRSSCGRCGGAAAAKRSTVRPTAAVARSCFVTVAKAPTPPTTEQ